MGPNSAGDDTGTHTRATAPTAGIGTRRRIRIWAGPLLVVTLLMTLLATMYLGYVVDPEKNLHDFPIALVNQDDGEIRDGEQVNVGDRITAALTDGIPRDKIDLRITGISEAQRLLANGEVYGAVILPSDLSKRLSILGMGGVVPGEIEQPVITVLTNPRTGTYATQIVQLVSRRALDQVNAEVGRQLVETVDTELASAPGATTELSGASRLMLAEPIEVLVEPYRPLPDGTGQGLSAFFYTLLVVLAGFTGAMIVHSMVDSALGFMPTEYGPFFVHHPTSSHSRFRTLLLKWGVIAVTAPLVSGVFLGVAALLDMPLDHAAALFLFSTLAIIAVGVTALSVLAVFGSAGLLVNLILFIVLGLPSAGGTIPLEATPRYMAWLATFEPMHQVYLGIRAILYFDAHGNPGLARGVWMSLAGLAIGLLLGAVVTVVYDRKGLRRGSR
ncbi:YhgE/Pip domain-containing protein [Nocardia sp. X0981]